MCASAEDAGSSIEQKPSHAAVGPASENRGLNRLLDAAVIDKLNCDRLAKRAARKG